MSFGRNNQADKINDIVVISTHICRVSTGILKFTIGWLVVAIEHVDFAISC